MKKALMTIAIVAIVAITGSLIYYFVFFRPEIEKAEIKLQEQQLEQENIKLLGLAGCLDKADKDFAEALNSEYKKYKEAWSTECKILSLAPDGRLPNDIANRLSEDYDRNVERLIKEHENRRADCFKFWQD